MQPSPCVVKVDFSCTSEDISVHVVEFNHPDSLLCAIEDERRVAPVFRSTWRFVAPHPISSIVVRLPSTLPEKRRHVMVRWICWLLQQIIHHSTGLCLMVVVLAIFAGFANPS